MINFVRAVSLAIFILSLPTPSANATTYQYAGNELSVSLPCCSSIPGLVGSVTFDFNTAGFSGTIFATDDRLLTLRLEGPAGPALTKDTWQGNSFTLTNGIITDWFLSSFEYGPNSFSSNGDYFYTGIFCGSVVCYLASNPTPGDWKAIDIAPVPGPVPGAGLPGLAFVIAGFIGWRRRRIVAA